MERRGARAPAAVVLATSATTWPRRPVRRRRSGFRVAVQATGHGALASWAGHDPGADLGMSGAPWTFGHPDGAGRGRRAVAARARRGDAARPGAAVGSAPGVGVVGYLTGGGIGPLVRTVGLRRTHVRAFEVVTGEGSPLRVTADEHADLFWGLRGGKATLGHRHRGRDRPAADHRVLRRRTVFRRGGRGSGAARVAAVVRRARRRRSTRRSRCSSCRRCPGCPSRLAGRFTLAVRYTAVGDFGEAERLLEPMRAPRPRCWTPSGCCRTRRSGGARRPGRPDAGPRGPRAAARAD